MARTLFDEEKYTIDTSSFNELFDEERRYNRENFPSLWKRVSELFDTGEIISHQEVYEEIQQGPYDDLKKWVAENKYVFKDYDLPKEGEIIKEIGEKFSTFVEQRKAGPNHADPWLVAQAKINNLTVITEETDRGVQIPVICREFTIPCINLFGLVKTKGWTI